jgi:hypothetical protein
MASIYIPLPEQIVGQEDPLIELGALEDARAFVSKLAPTFMHGESAEVRSEK